MSETSGNRRAFMRHDDHVILQLRRLEAAEAEEIVDRLGQWRMQFRLDEVIGAEARSMGEALSRIRSRDSDVAACLAHLERRIELLASHFQDSAGTGADEGPVPVNLSGQGLRCETNEALEDGDAVEVGIALLPDYQLVAAIGQIIRSEREGERRTVSIHFKHLLDRDQETLVQHVFRLERDAHALRRRAA